MDPTVYVIGSSNMDLITICDRIPDAGETILGNYFYTRCGGKGANQAVALAKLCADKSRVRFLTTIGNDINGDEIKCQIRKYGLDVAGVITIPDVSTGVATICIDKKGENSIIVIPGANGAFSIDIFDQFVISNTCKIVVLQLEIPTLTVKKILRFCKSHDIVTILNPAPASKDFMLTDSEFSCIDILIPNETESHLITGMGADADKEMMLTEMLHIHPNLVVIMTLGGRGAYVGFGDDRFAVSCPSVTVKDTVGAGDCFVGTFAYLLSDFLINNTFNCLSEESLETIVQKSCNASSYCVQFKGGFDKYPTNIINSWEESLCI